MPRPTITVEDGPAVQPAPPVTAQDTPTVQSQSKASADNIIILHDGLLSDGVTYMAGQVVSPTPRLAAEATKPTPRKIYRLCKWVEIPCVCAWTSSPINANPSADPSLAAALKHQHALEAGDVKLTGDQAKLLQPD